MKLSVSAFRAQASAQRKILSSYQNQLNYGACTSFPALGGYAADDKAQMTVDSTPIHPTNATTSQPLRPATPSQHPPPPTADQRLPPSDHHPPAPLDKTPTKPRSKSNQRWMKLRTTVQLSGAIASTSQKSKAPLKREDSFLKRFSTRQIPETQETVDTGDETETHNGSQAQNEVNRRRRRRRKEMSRTVVNPDENFYFYWLLTVTVCILYNLWTLIVRQSFPELQKAASAFWYSGDGFTDVVYVCDIIVQFRTGYLEQGLMVYDSKKLASHYVKSRAFLLDTLSLFPLDFLQLNFGVNPLLRFPRFLKVYRAYNYYYIVESRTVYPNLWRVVNLIHILLILAHWFGCFYYLLSEAEGFHGDWVYPHRPGDYATLTRKYLASLYWSTLTLTTIGDLPTPETNAESRGHSKAVTSPGQSEATPRRGRKSRLLQFNSNCGYLFTIVSYLIGVFIFATIVGQVGNVITNRNANRLEFERLLDGAKTYMRHHKVPGGMKRRVLRWYDYSWSRGRIQGGGDINTALGLLPDKLKTELALHVNLSVLKKVTIFQECQPEFLHDLVLKMKAYIFTPGDLICRKGEVAREMFIIADGILDVISENGRVLTTMKAGDFFGEIGILNLDGLNKRTADVRSVGYSELFSLSREDVLSAMKDYPEAQEILQSLGRKRLMEAKNAAKLHKGQVRQSKDHDSSGESDTAGKRIVDKLRSDVKGLRKALRRSRRDTGTMDLAAEITRGRTSAKKQSLLRRMSHVQSSDECESTAEAEPNLIGAGLPLLQRLKLLRERQENEGEEKENARKAEGSPRKRVEGGGEEAAGVSVASCQKVKSARQKEVPGAVGAGPGMVPSTVRTQVTGAQAGRSTPKWKSLGCPGGGVEDIETKGKEEKSLLKGRLKVAEGVQAEEKGSECGTVPEEETNANSVSGPEVNDSFEWRSKAIECSDDGYLNSEAEGAESEGGTGTSVDGWKLLKESSISCPESERKVKGGESGGPKKGSNKVTYLSKSDTVLERQKSVQQDEESVSPLEGSECEDGTVEGLPRKRKRFDPGDAGGFRGDSPDEEKPRRMKKYNSIKDLSPEYSGLPFVKKLKILNERQKLEELEKELVVRSVSLDVSEGPKSKGRSVLMRSQSEASSVEVRGAGGTSQYECRSPIEKDKRSERSTWRCSEGSMVSPESNETLERRHLKSILKKLSGEGSTSDEEKTSKPSQVLRKCGKASPGWKTDESTELRKLMREPTMEGYVARHKKLTKSVTFDSDTLTSPLDAVAEQPPADASGTGYYSPKSPTAILTLQLSNLSMLPIASPKKQSNSQAEGQKHGYQEGAHAQTSVSSAANKLLEQRPFALPSYRRRDQFFDEIQTEILVIVNQLLEKAHGNFESQLTSLQTELKQRDQTIVNLQSKILDLEKKYLQNAPEDAGEGNSEVLERNSDGSGADSDLSDAVLQREEFCETTRDVFGCWPREGFDVGGEDLEDASSCRSEGRAVGWWEYELSESGVEQEGRDHEGGEGDEGGRRRKEKGRGKGKPKRKLGKKSFMDRLSKLQRSMSSCQEKKADFVSLTIEESSNCSDAESVEGGDWEVEMLVQELGKKDPYWEVKEEWEGEAEGDVGHSEDVKKLREEVNTLKQVVCDSDLSRLTSSELDILESIIDAKDQKIIQISKCKSLDSEVRNDSGRTATSASSSGPDVRATESGRSKKSLRKKIGQALSFDFHDMESRKPKPPKTIKHRRYCTKTQKIASHRNHQSLYSLWRTSARLRNRMLDDSDSISRNPTDSGSISPPSRSSLPILISTSPDHKQPSTLTTSLPLLSAKDFATSVCDCLTSSLDSRPSPPPPTEPPHTPTLHHPQPPNTLNTFIKSVGQRVKQVMLGEINSSRTQVPTISKLLEDKATPNSPEAEAPAGPGAFSPSASASSPAPNPTAPSKALDSFDHDP